MQNIYGQNGPLALILIGSVPLYNVAAVLLLTLMAPGGGHLDRKTMKKTLRGIVGNPIILGILAGVVWSLLGIPLARHGGADRLQAGCHRNAAGPDRSGRQHRSQEGCGAVETHGGVQCLQTGRFCGTIFAAATFWVPGGVAGGDPGDAGLSHDRQLLYYGAQHGT